MADQDPPTNGTQASLQTPIYDIAKKCFLGIAKVLPVFTNDHDIVRTSMPTGKALQLQRDLIENSLERLRIELSKQSEWKKVRIASKDKKEFFIILYRSDLLEKEAIECAFAKGSEMRQLEYTELELRGN